MKRFLSVLLTLALLMSLVSVSAVAEGETMMPPTTTASSPAGLRRS